MTTSKNEKAGAEARADVSHRRSPGRYEGGLARALAGIAYAVIRGRNKHTAEDDKSAPEPTKK
jgi:hypothetical protein